MKSCKIMICDLICKSKMCTNTIVKILECINYLWCLNVTLAGWTECSFLFSSFLCILLFIYSTELYYSVKFSDRCNFFFYNWYALNCNSCPLQGFLPNRETTVLAVVLSFFLQYLNEHTYRNKTEYICVRV